MFLWFEELEFKDSLERYIVLFKYYLNFFFMVVRGGEDMGYIKIWMKFSRKCSNFIFLNEICRRNIVFLVSYYFCINIIVEVIKIMCDKNLYFIEIL